MSTRLECLAFTIAAATLLAAAGCSGERQASGAGASNETEPRLVKAANGIEALELRIERIPGLNVVPVKRVELPVTLETTGQVALDDRRAATIISRVTGRVEDASLSQWDNVKRGQPIVTLYSPDYMTAAAEYLQAVATSQLSSHPGLSDKSRLADAIVEAARRKLELLGIEDADIDEIATPKPTFVMRAPISGTVVQREVVKGSQVNPGDVLFSLGVTDEVWITADVYESDLARVHDGQPLEAVPLAFPDEIFKGAIARISPNIDPATHTAQIRCQVHNSALRLKPQMLMRVRIVTSAGEALVVPQESLVFETDSYYAFVELEPDKITRRKVTIASWNERGNARVLTGLESGQLVIQGESLQVDALWHQAHGESS
jgi:membrane fusion protein, copper/silver efflux system